MAAVETKTEERVLDPNQNRNQRVGKQQHTRAAKNGFFHLESTRGQPIDGGPRPPSLPHLIIGKKILFLAHSLKPRK
jgi:hypothetical protein